VGLRELLGPSLETGHSLVCHRSIPIIADVRREVCDGAHHVFVMKNQTFSGFSAGPIALDTCASVSYANGIWTCNSLLINGPLYGKRLRAGGFDAKKTR